MFKKDDLKVGYVVKLHSGRPMLVTAVSQRNENDLKVLVDNYQGYLSIDNDIDDQLKAVSGRVQNDIDIIYGYPTVYPPTVATFTSISDKNRLVIWQRETY